MLKPPYCKLGYDDKKPPRETRHSFGLYSKSQYSPGVKNHGWEYELGAKPYDFDPLNPINITVGHYKLLGTEKLDYSTETNEKFTFPKSRILPHHHSKMMNVYSYIDDEPFEENEEFGASHFFSDYSTTMQSSYKPPYPYVMQRLSLPSTPYFTNRRLDQGIDFSPLKFYDEEYLKHIRRLQKYKVHRHVSFNPWIGKYTDGSM